MLVRAKLQFEGFDNATLTHWESVRPVFALCHGSGRICHCYRRFSVICHYWPYAPLWSQDLGKGDCTELLIINEFNQVQIFVFLADFVKLSRRFPSLG